MPTIIIHIMNEDPVMGEIDQLPSPNDTMLLVKSPRRKDGKDLSFVDSNATTVIWPVNRLNFVEVLSSGAEEEIISSVRE